MKIHVASKAFGSAQILKDIALDLEPGRITALLGPSGTGKTTLLRIVGGLDPSFKDTAGGSEIIGMMFQEPRLLPWLDACENIEIVGASRAEAERLLERMGLGDSAALYPRQLSLGMARRVALARAIAVRPTLLLLDEPFASLDMATAVELRQQVASLRGDGRLKVLLVSHDPLDAATLADEIAILAGRPATIVRRLSFGSPLPSRSGKTAADYTAQITAALAAAASMT